MMKTTLHRQLLSKQSDVSLYALLKALPPVCMKYTAGGESRVANIAQAKLSAIFVMRPSLRAVSFIQTKCQCLSVLLYFTPINVRIKHSSLIVLNKGIA